MKKHSFVFGALLLGISGVLCKILGALYKIPLTNILGTQGMGIYYLIFPIYSFLLSIASYSLTIVISKKISQAFSSKNYFEINKVFKCGLILLVFLGLVLGLFVCFFSRIIARLQGVENAYVCYLVIAPAIIAVCIQSVFKGFFQGLQNMVPTALSQIIEQIVKLSLGFTFAFLLFKKGVVYGAFGALVGLSLSEIITCLFFVIYYIIFKAKNKFLFKFSKTKYNLFKEMWVIFKESLPFMLSSVILPMSLVIDSFLIINTLKYLGFEKGFATSLLGVNSGIINTLVGLPTAVCGAFCVVIIPYITFALSKKDYTNISNKIEISVKITFFLCLPCVLFFGIFSKEILSVLYSYSFAGEYSLNLASTLLTVSCINVLYLSFLQITTSVLQALNRSYLPVLSLSIALIFKVILEVLLISNPYINIVGAVISNSVCYFFSSVVNLIFIKKEIPLNFSFYRLIICPLISSLFSYFSAEVLLNLIFKSFSALNILISFLFAGLFYVILIFVLKGLSGKEIKAIFNRNKQRI